MGDATGQLLKAWEYICNRMTTPEKNRPSGVARSVSWPHPDWDALVREQFTPDITRILLNSKLFVKRNGAEFFLIVVHIWSTIIWNVWRRWLLPKKGQPVHMFTSHPALWMFAWCLQYKHEILSLFECWDCCCDFFEE